MIHSVHWVPCNSMVIQMEIEIHSLSVPSEPMKEGIVGIYHDLSSMIEVVYSLLMELVEDREWHSLHLVLCFHVQTLRDCHWIHSEEHRVPFSWNPLFDGER